MPVHFVLNQNFPLQATALPWPPLLRVSALRAIDPRLVQNVDDWQILYELDQRGDVPGVHHE